MKTKEASYELLEFVAKNNFYGVEDKKSIVLAELNLLLQSLQFQMVPWGQNLQAQRILIYVGVDEADIIKAESFYVYGFNSISYDSNSSWKFAKEDVNGKKVIAIIFSNTTRLDVAMSWHKAFKEADLCFCNVDAKFFQCANKEFRAVKSQFTFGKTHRFLFRQPLVFGRFFDQTLKVLQSEVGVNDGAQKKDLRFLTICKANKKNYNIFTEEIKKFDKSIVQQLKKFPEERFLSNLGKFSFLKNVIVKNNVIYNSQHNVYTRYLMTNDLARGIDVYKEKYKHPKSIRELIKFLWHILKRKSRKIAEPCFRASVPSPALSHWLIDNFIPFLVARLLYGDLKFLYNCQLADYQIYQLEFFGIKESDIIVTSPEDRIEVDNLITVDKFYNPDPIFSFSSIHYHEFNSYLDEIFLKNLNQKHIKKIYVSRQDAKKARVLLNETEIEGYLVSQGFHVVLGSQISAKELIEIYSQASLIVGPLGAGLLNSIFSKSGVTVIALTSPGYYESHLAQVSSLRGNFFRYLIGEELSADDGVEGGVRNSNFYIPLAKIKSVLEGM
jgi:hypothetical protein